MDLHRKRRGGLIFALLFFFFAFAAKTQGPIAHYVRAGAGGGGTDWANASGSLPSQFARGDVYYVAKGSYSGATFSTPASGSLVVTIKGATAADHGTDTGWNNAYSVSAADGGGSATFGSISITTSYWTFDGNTNPPLWSENPADYGFSFGSSLSRGFTLGSSGSVSNNGPAITQVYLARIYAKATSSDTEKEFIEGASSGGAHSNVTITRCLLDGWQGLFMTKGQSGAAYANWVVTYNALLNGFSSSANHGEWINPNERPLDNATIAYNLFKGRSGSAGMTGIIVANNSDNNNAKIYGNVFDGVLVGNGIITGTSAGKLNNAVVYNNTFLNSSVATNNAIGGSGQGTGNVAYNNLFYNMSGSYGGGFAHDYSAYFSATNAASEAHSQTGSGNPFAPNSYQLGAETSSGMTLAAPYNSDGLGNARPGPDGTWSRGAFQFGGSQQPQPVQISVSPSSANVQAGSSQQFVAMVTGSSNTAVAWSASNGQISATGLYTAPASAGSATVTATAQADTSKTASASVTISAQPPPQPVQISIAPASATVPTGGTQQFSAAVTGSTNLGVNWSATGGSVSASGLFTASSTAGSAIVTAQAQADTSKTASANVTVVAPTPPPSGFSTIRINSGGPAYTDSQGNTWSADRLFSGGSTYSNTKTISNTSDQKLYQSERWGAFTYTIPVPAGSYSVTLREAEIYFSKTGQRIFSVTINGAAVLSNFDIVAVAGAANRALDQTFPVTLSGDGNIVVKFVTGSKDDPKLSALMVESSGGTPPPLPISVSVSPSTVNLQSGAAQQFTATVLNATNQAVTWSVSSPPCGAVDSTGLFTANNAAGSCSVSATSVADQTKVASASVNVAPPPASLTLSCNGLTCTLSPVNIPGGTPIQVSAQGGGASASVTTTVP